MSNFKAKMHQNRFGGCAPDPAGGSLQRSLADPLAGLKGGPDPAGGAYDAPPDLLVGWEGIGA